MTSRARYGDFQEDRIGPSSDATERRAHLVVGLGGIGRSTINRLQRDLSRRDGGAAPVRFLAIDLEDAARSPLASPPTLLRDDENDLLPLDMASVREYGGQLQGEVREWLSRYDAAMDIGSDRAANPRRLGSLLLAAKAPQLRACLEERANALLAASPLGAVLQIHVVGYLAGGIGGGALTQLLETIRRDPSAGGQGRVVVYGLLPSLDDDGTDEDRRAAAANTGAALKELSGARPRVQRRVGESAETRELGFQRLCDEILVIAPPERTGRASWDSQTLPEALAMAIRQRMLIGALAPPAEQPDSPFATRPIIALAPKAATTGAGEIEDALALTVLQSALFQILHANWRHRRGYLPEAAPRHHADFVRRSDVQARWRLSADHMIQSAAVLPGDEADPRWRLMTEEWAQAIDGIVELARTQPQRDWLDCVTRLASLHFGRNFRNVGVAAFFQERRTRKREIARVMRRSVERDLFDDWMRGERGFADLRAILNELIALQRERLAGIDDRLANIRMAEETGRVRVVAAHQEWSRSRRWGWLFSRNSVALLRAYGVNLQELHVNMTRAEGWLFARVLLPAVIEELENLRTQTDHLAKAVSDSVREADYVLDGLSARMEADGDSEATFVMHLYDGERLRRFVQDLLCDERGQMAHAEAFRSLLARQAGTDGAFRPLADWLRSADWMNAAVEFCRAQVAGPQGRWTAPVRELLGASIYDAIDDRCGGDFGRLRDLAAAFIGNIGDLLPDAAGSRLPTRLHVVLPDVEGREEYAKALRSAFSFSRRGDVRFVHGDGGSDAIHMLTVTAPFSIPDIDLLRRMDRHYRDYVERDREYAMLSLHALGGATEGEGGFSLDGVAPSTMTTALILVGLPLNLIVERGGGSLEGTTLWLVPKDADGFDEPPIPLAEDLLTAGGSVSGPIASLLEDNVMRALGAYGGDPARLIEAVVDEVAKVRRRCGDNPANPVYRSFVEAGKTAAALIRENAQEREGDGH
jgi:hypothetical protein